MAATLTMGDTAPETPKRFPLRKRTGTAAHHRSKAAVGFGLDDLDGLSPEEAVFLAEPTALLLKTIVFGTQGAWPDKSFADAPLLVEGSLGDDTATSTAQKESFLFWRGAGEDVLLAPENTTEPLPEEAAEVPFKDIWRAKSLFARQMCR